MGKPLSINHTNVVNRQAPDAQVGVLEKKQHDDEACGERVTADLGYLGSQDTFYVGNLKGVCRIYQQTLVDISIAKPPSVSSIPPRGQLLQLMYLTTRDCLSLKSKSSRY